MEATTIRTNEEQQICSREAYPGQSGKCDCDACKFIRALPEEINPIRLVRFMSSIILRYDINRAEAAFYLSEALDLAQGVANDMAQANHVQSIFDQMAVEIAKATGKVQ